MENTIENKAKFFAQYYDQNVLMGYSGVSFTINTHHLSKDYLGKHETDEDLNRIPYLELTPLSQITDEIARKLDFMSSSHFIKVMESYGDEFSRLLLKHEHVDVLRLNGYAIDWNNLSVEKQIEFGWVKLKES